MTNKVTNKTDNPGATDTQVAILTDRITTINAHLKTNRKDHSSRRGLLLLVSRRRKLLKYLKRTDLDGYKTLIKQLNIRK